MGSDKRTPGNSEPTDQQLLYEVRRRLNREAIGLVLKSCSRSRRDLADLMESKTPGERTFLDD